LGGVSPLVFNPIYGKTTWASFMQAHYIFWQERILSSPVNAQKRVCQRKMHYNQIGWFTDWIYRYVISSSKPIKRKTRSKIHKLSKDQLYLIAMGASYIKIFTDEWVTLETIDALRLSGIIQSSKNQFDLLENYSTEIQELNEIVVTVKINGIDRLDIPIKIKDIGSIERMV
jgi:hypothetical protein